MTAISVVLPAKDEEHRIAATLERLVAAAPATGITEIIVVDDGSTDRTAAIVREFAQHPTPLVRLVQHERNRGKSASLRTGMQAAQGDLIALFDADLSVGPEHLADAVALIEGGADVVTG
ncbi:MAG: glycosyltransferase family 2 protein, partial [Dehalococcoidia bacterium]|nr:glycosyltransferase family 2 protein [Dehalococcoidia bacterium]